MQTYNVTIARAKLYNLVNQVNEDHKPVQIQGKKGDAVLISAKDWEAIEETLYLSGIPGLVEDLRAGLDEPIESMPSADEVDW